MRNEFELQDRQYGFYPLADFAGIDSLDLGCKPDVGLGREPRQQVVGLEYDTDIVRRCSLQTTKYFYRAAGVGHDQAGDDSQQRALPAPARTYNRDELAAPHVERDGVECAHSVCVHEGLGDAQDANSGFQWVG